MKVSVFREQRHDGVALWRLRLFLKRPHEQQAKPYRKAYATAKEANDRADELRRLWRAKGMDGLVRELLDGGRDPAPTPAQTLANGLEVQIAAFLAAKEAAGRRERTLGNLKHRLGVLLRSFGDRRVEDITASDLEGALERINLSPRSRLNMLIAWRNFFRWLRRRGELRDVPTDGMESPTVRRTAPAVLSAWYVARIVAAAWYDRGSRRAPGRMLPYALLCFYSAIRPEEVERLSWATINLKDRVAVLDETVTKTSRLRHVRLSPELAKVLQRLKSRGLQPGFFSRRAWDRIRARARVDGAQWSVDIGRHTYASLTYAATHDEGGLSADMGNSVAVLRKHYVNRLVTPRETKRWKQVLDRVGNKLARPKRTSTI